MIPEWILYVVVAVCWVGITAATWPYPMWRSVLLWSSVFALIVCARIFEYQRCHESPQVLTPVDITVYNAVESQTDSSPLITADGSVIDPDSLPNWIAVSRDLLEVYPFGTEVEIRCKCPYDGEIREVRDVMAARYSAAIDILTDDTVGLYQGIVYLNSKSADGIKTE